MQISKQWGKHPFWFDEQPKKTQLVLLAEYQISNFDSKENPQHKRQKFDDIMVKRKKRMGIDYGKQKNKIR